MQFCPNCLCFNSPYNPPTFGAFFIQVFHLKPFTIVVLNGEITVYSVDSPNGFEWYVCRSADTKPCFDLSKW